MRYSTKEKGAKGYHERRKGPWEFTSVWGGGGGTRRVNVWGGVRRLEGTYATRTPPAKGDFIVNGARGGCGPGVSESAPHGQRSQTGSRQSAFGSG